MPKGQPKDNKYETKDHEGRKFASFSEMCAYYNKPITTVKNRLDRGWSLEQALTVPNDDQKRKIKPHNGIPWKDHLGNEYISLPKMCAAYGITEKIFQSRKRLLKWPLEKILTTPVAKQPPNSKKTTDHLGNEFPSVSEMCRYHKVSLSLYKERIKRGWDVERALTAPAKKINDMSNQRCIDHLGHEYPSKKAMCDAYHISRYTMDARLERGWDLEKALTAPYVINSRQVVDYKNREFPTLKDMANFYGLEAYQLQGLEEINNDILQKMVVNRFAGTQVGNITINRCVAFPYFEVTINGNKYVIHLETILTKYHESDTFNPLPQTKIPNPYITIKKQLKFPYYLIEIDGEETIASYWQIIRKNTESNFGIRNKTKK